MSAVLGPGKFFQTWVPKSEKEGAQAIADNVPEYRTNIGRRQRSAGQPGWFSQRL